MRHLREFIAWAIVIGTVFGVAFGLEALGLNAGISVVIGVLFSLALWGFVIRKLRRYRIVQIMFNVDNRSVLRDKS